MVLSLAPRVFSRHSRGFLISKTNFRQFKSGNPTMGECTPSNAVKIALCQIKVGNEKKKNIETARMAIRTAAENGAKIVCLPECWNSPYATASFPVYAEFIPSMGTEVQKDVHPSTHMLLKMAADCGIYLVGGSMPERDGDAIFNTSIVVDPSGSIIAKHRKMHLFDIDVPGKITFKESDTLSAGNAVTVFNTPFFRIGLGICYDIRFPELSTLMREEGAKLLLFPGAFNLTTGPAHWELLQRARAVDNQLYVAAVSPARNEPGGYQAWGHSTVVAPWGDVIASTGHDEDIVYAMIEPHKADDMRESIPTAKQRRHDVYVLKRLV